MWLPTPFYEKAPHYWLVLGLLFIVFGVYLGLAAQSAYLYIGIFLGIGCCAWSLRVFKIRARSKQSRAPEPVATPITAAPEVSDVPE